MDQLQQQLTEERAKHAAAVAEIAQLQNLVAELRREVRDLRVVNQEEQERKRARGQEVENETVETQTVPVDQIGVTKEKRDNEDDLHRMIGSRLSNGLFKPEYVDDTIMVQKCANSLLEIREVDEVLLREVPLWSTKYSNTINRIRKNALILLKYRFQIPNLPILHKISKHNYLLFMREKNEGIYKQHAEAAEKLEDSLLKSISITAEVVKELGITCDK